MIKTKSYFLCFAENNYIFPPNWLQPDCFSSGASTQKIIKIIHFKNYKIYFRKRKYPIPTTSNYYKIVVLNLDNSLDISWQTQIGS